MPRWLLPAALAAAFLVHPTTLESQDGPPPEVRQAISRVLAMLRTQDDSSLSRFAKEALSERYLASTNEAALLSQLRGIRDGARGRDGEVDVSREDDGTLVITLNGDTRIRLALDASAKIDRLELAGARGARADASGAGRTVEAGAARGVAGGPPTTRAEARPRHVRALEGTQRLALDSALGVLERQNFAPSYLQRTSRAERLEVVGRVRTAAASSGNVMVREDDAGVHIMLRGEAGLEVTFTMEEQAPFRITSLKTAPLGPEGPRPSGPPVTWDNLQQRLADAAAAGFSGQVLVRRQGKDVFRSTYGYADSLTRRRTAPNDIYCIGSAPIDFTVTAARLLAQRGTLALDEPISRYLPGVPGDKATMTPRMLLEGRSGLPDFHDEDGDWDKDLAWIDRETAVRRILSRPLLFEPGARRQHSHSAYGLLAAIVEVASGTTYPEFVRAEILRPLGMTRTGFYGESLGLPATDFATGYGASAIGAPNIPPNWGPTSWLVMGSGGMFSTLDDLRRYNDAMASGALIPGSKPTPRRGVEVDGSDRGFYLTRIDNGAGDAIFLLSNTETSPVTNALAESLMRLVMGAGAPAR